MILYRGPKIPELLVQVRCDLAGRKSASNFYVKSAKDLI